MNHDDLIAKLQKLLALAQRGEGGEAVNARELLDKMMAKYGIDEASLTDIRTLRCATDSDAEKELLIVVISFALQIPTVQVEADIIVRTDYFGMDLKMTVEQHGLTAALFQHHRVGLGRSIEKLASDQSRQAALIHEEIGRLTSKIRDLKAISGNLKKTQEKALQMAVCAYVNLNNLVDYAGWKNATSDGSDAIQSAMASCVQMDTNPNQLPAQRLGNDNQSDD